MTGRKDVKNKKREKGRNKHKQKTERKGTNKQPTLYMLFVLHAYLYYHTYCIPLLHSDLYSYYQYYYYINTLVMIAPSVFSCYLFE